MKDRHYIIVGLFVLGGLVLLSILVIWFGGVARLIRETYTVEAHLPTALNISPGKRVFKDGIEVGSVGSITSSLPQRAGVWLHLAIEADVRIPRDAEFIAEQGLTGDVTLDFRTTQPIPPGETPAEEYLPTDGSAKVDGRLKPPAMLPENFVDKLSKAMDIVDKIGPLIDNLSRLTKPVTPEQVAEGEPQNLFSTLTEFERMAKRIEKLADDIEAEQLVTQLTASAKSLQETLANARGTIGRIDKLVEAYTAAGQDVKDTLASFRQTSETLGAAGQDARKTLAGANELIAGLSADAKAARTTLSDIQDVVATIRSGKGTLGKLVEDDELYRVMVTMMQSFDQLSEDVQRLVTLWREQGILAKQGH